MKSLHHGLAYVLALLWALPVSAADQDVPMPQAPTAPGAGTPNPPAPSQSPAGAKGEASDEDPAEEADDPENQGATGDDAGAPAPSAAGAAPTQAEAPQPQAAADPAAASPAQQQPPASQPAASQPPPAQPAATQKAGMQVGLGLSSPDDPTRDEKKDDKSSDADKDKTEGGYLTLDVTSTLGTGTFLRDPNVRNPYVDWAGTLLPGYVFADGTNASLRFVVTQELTKSDSSTEANQLLLADLRPGVARDILTFGPVDTKLKGEAYVYLPTSLASRAESLYAALEGRLWVQQPIAKKFRVAYRTAYRKNFHQYSTGTVDPEADDGLVKAFAREGGSERVAAAAISTGDNNVEHYWSNRLLVGYSPLDTLSFDLWYTLGHGWTYESYPLDDLSGEGAQEGRGRRDSSEAVLVASYQYSKALAFSGGLQTVSTPRQADGQGLRFPFYEFEGTALNLSAFFFSVTFNQPFPL